MATSKHFLEQVKTGNIAAALQKALDNAGSLKIVTRIVGDGAGNEDVDALPDSQKICTYIDAIAGTIETLVGSQFIAEGAHQALCEGHMQQVVAGCSSIRDNLDTLQALLDWVSQEPPIAQETMEETGDRGDAPADPAELSFAETALANESALEPSLETAPSGLGIGAAVGLAGAVGLATGVPSDNLDFSDSAVAGDLGSDLGDDLGSDLVSDLGEDFGGDLGEDLGFDLSQTPESLDLDGVETAPGLFFGAEPSDAPEGNAGDSLLAGDLPDQFVDSSADSSADSLADSLADNLTDDLSLAPEASLSFDNDLPLDASADIFAEAAQPQAEFLADAGSDDLDLSAVGGDDGSSFGDLGFEGSFDGGNFDEGSFDELSEADPLADVDLGDDPFAPAVGSAGEAFASLGQAVGDAPAAGELLRDDTLTGVSWAESEGAGDLELDMLGLESDIADEAVDPEVDALALDAIDDFDSGIWDEASAETVNLQGEPAKVSRSLESLFSAEEAETLEAETDGADPLSALFSDTSLDDIAGLDADLGTASEESGETLAANPFEIGDLENDPFADLMIDDH